MKPSITKLELAKLKRENDALAMALTDVVNGDVKWFGNDRAYSVGVTRPRSATGGVLILRTFGSATAHYLEQFAADELAQIASCMTGEDTDYNRELMGCRVVLESAMAYVAEAKK